MISQFYSDINIISVCEHSYQADHNTTVDSTKMSFCSRRFEGPRHVEAPGTCFLLSQLSPQICDVTMLPSTVPLTSHPHTSSF